MSIKHFKTRIAIDEGHVKIQKNIVGAGGQSANELSERVFAACHGKKFRFDFYAFQRMSEQVMFEAYIVD